MTEIITRTNRYLYDDIMEDMFEQRYRVLIKGLGWNVPGCEVGRDVDAFDAEDTVYIIECHPDTGQLIASSRLNPTTKPHLMSEVFPHQCELRGVPQADTIWELSRVVYDPERMQGQLFKKTRAALKLAITEFCLATGIQALTWLSRREMFASTTTFWSTRPLGGSQFYTDDQQHYVAAISEIDEAALLATKAKFSEYSDEDLVLTSRMPSSAWRQSLVSSIGMGGLRSEGDRRANQHI